MASNKFSGRRYRGHYPAYCWPTPRPGPAVPPGSPALRLWCMCRWTDLDPLGPADQMAMFPLERVGPGNIYFGESAPAGDRLNLHAEQLGTTPYWTIILSVWDPWRTPEHWTWPGVFINPNLPFDTRLLQDVFIPNHDYRLARLTT